MALGKMQLIAIGVVAILAIAAISFVIINNNNDDEGTPLDVGVAEFRLDVYGNANEDLKIDEADKQIIQDIIDGKKDIADYPLANANMDKVNKKANVDAEDLALVDKMIAGEPCTVYIICLDASGGEVELPIEFPVINAVCWGSNMLTPFINSGAVDHCAGYMAKKSSSYPVINDVLFSSDATNIEVSRQMDSNKWQDFMDLDSECTSAGKGIDAFFVDHSVTSLNDNPNYRVDLRDSGIPEIRLAVADPIGDINAALLMGFLTCETAGYDYAVASIDAYREVVDIIEAITNPV